VDLADSRFTDIEHLPDLPEIQLTLIINGAVDAGVSVHAVNLLKNRTFRVHLHFDQRSSIHFFLIPLLSLDASLGGRSVQQVPDIPD
jgi:hypothetical protein